MSRSYKKRATCWLGCHSEKSWKQFWHKIYRHKLNGAIREGNYDDMPSHLPISDVWSSPSDGKIDLLTPTFPIFTQCDLDDPTDVAWVKKHFVKVGKHWKMRK